MTLTKDKVIHIRTSHNLYNTICQSAHREGLGLSAYCRRILTLWHDGNGETLRLPENLSLLVDSREKYTTEEE